MIALCTILCFLFEEFFVVFVFSTNLTGVKNGAYMCMGIRDYQSLSVCNSRCPERLCKCCFLGVTDNVLEGVSLTSKELSCTM